MIVAAWQQVMSEEAVEASWPELSLLDCGARSSLLLPELPPWRATPTAAPVAITLAEVAPEFTPLTRVSSLVSIGAAGRCRVEVPGIARYFLSDGRTIVVAPEQGSSPHDIRLFLLGPVLSMLCHQRGLLPLRGAGVHGRGGATLCSGPPGVGKSTLAAALALEGYAILGDDFVPLRDPTAGAPAASWAALPTVPRLKLWRDSLDALSISCDGLQGNRSGQQCYHYCGPVHGDVSAAVELTRIVLVEPAKASSSSLEPLPPAVAARRLFRAIEQLPFALALGLRDRLVQAVECVAARVPVLRLVHRVGFAELRDSVALLSAEMSRLP